MKTLRTIPCGEISDNFESTHFLVPSFHISFILPGSTEGNASDI